MWEWRIPRNLEASEVNTQGHDFPRIPNGRLVSLSVLVLLVCLFYTYAAAYVAPYSGVEVSGDLIVEALEPCAANEAWCEANQGTLQLGDQLLVIGDLTYAESVRDRSRTPFAGYKPGDRVPITFRRDGEERTVYWQMLGPTTISRIRRLVRSVLTYAPFWLAGTLILLFLRPRDRRWRLLVLFSYTTAIWLAAGIYSNLRVAYASPVQHALAWLLAPVYLHLHLAVPSPLLRRYQRRLLLPLYAIAAILAGLELFQALPRAAFYLGLLTAFLGSLGVLVFRLLTSPSAADRLATRLMLAGIGLALGPGIMLAVIPALFNVSEPSGLVLNIVTFAIPLLPLFYIYALYKRQLGTLEFRANRLLSTYSFTSLYVTTFILIFLCGSWWINLPDSLVAFSLTVSTVFVVAALPLRTRFQRLINRLAYGTEHDPDDIIRVFASQIPAAVDREDLVRLLVDEVAPSLLIRQSALLLVTDGDVDLVYARQVSSDELPKTPQQVEQLLAGAGRYRPPLTEMENGHSDGLGFDWVRLAIPVEIRKETMGLWLFGQRDPDDYYPQHDVALLTTLAGQVAVALDNARLLEETRRRLRREKRLNELARALGGEMDLARLIPHLLSLVVELSGADASAVAIIDPERQVITYPYSLNVPESLVKVEAPLGTGLAGYTMETRRPVLVDDYREHPAVLPAWVEAGVRSVLVVPLLIGDEVVGSMALFSLGKVRPFGPEAMATVEAAGHLAAVAIQRARLFQAEQRRRQEAETLREAALSLTTTLDQQRVLELVLGQLQQVVPYDSASVQLLRDNRMEIIGGRGFSSPEKVLGFSFLLSNDNPNSEVMRRRAPFIVDDVVPLYEEFQREPHAQAQTRAWMGVPMLIGEQLIGMIALDKREPGFYTERHARLAQAFAAQAAVAIENARLFQAERWRAEEMAVLYEVSLNLGSQLELDVLLQTIVEQVVRLLGTQGGGLYLYDAEREELELVVSHNMGANHQGLRMKVGEGLSGRIVQSGQPLIVEDYGQWEGQAAAWRGESFVSVIGAPLKYQDRILGVINATDYGQRRSFSEEDLRLLTLFAAQAAIAIENARLFEAAQHEIAERKRAEEALRESERRYRDLYEGITDAVLVHDFEGKILDANRIACERLGYAYDELVGMRVRDIITSEFTDLTLERVQQVIAGTTPQLFESAYCTKDGCTISVEINARVVTYGGRQVIQSVVRDITERKQMQARLMQAEKLAAVGELVAGVAHELNNPLTAVVGYAQLLQRQPVVEEGVKHKLNVIFQEAQRSAGIVNNLLAFARQHKPERRYVDVNDLVERALELLAYQLRTDNVEVVRQLDPSVPPTMADPNQLQQVFVNLITNARQAMAEAHERGTLTVATRRVGEDRIRVEFHDDGPGIARQVINKIFDPFFTTKEVGQGTGLGLSICYGLVAEHGGRIWADSEEGKGATFVVELPVVEEDVNWAEEALAQMKVPPVRGWRILVVDDEQLIIDLLTDVLGEDGHQVVGVCDGRAALRALEEEEYDLIISDLKMPGLSGRQLYAHLKAGRPDMVKRIVFTTGDVVSPGTKEFLVQTGCRYLAKPFDVSEVSAVVNEVLAGDAVRV